MADIAGHNGAGEAPRETDDTPFGANAVRLTPRQWVVAIAACALLLGGLPRCWGWLERLETGEDYRIPYGLSDDYWLYGRVARAAASADRIPVFGDSVIWGQFAEPGGALPQALNDALGEDRFANLGLNGSHPAALAGLLRHHGGGVRGGKVVLHFNPLWMSSARRDLRTDRPARFNHPDLVPQFYPDIPSYDADFARRLGVAIGQRAEFIGWLKHLRMAYFDNRNLPDWTARNPYGNPLAQITFALPAPDPEPASAPVPWTETEMGLQAFEWTGAEESLQWRFFQRSLAQLRARNNRVFVVVGPLNEHMLAEGSRAQYRALLSEIRGWLDREEVPAYFPQLLPADLYGDTSHPLRSGYALWAREMLGDEGFREFLGGPVAGGAQGQLYPGTFPYPRSL